MMGLIVLVGIAMIGAGFTYVLLPVNAFPPSQRDRAIKVKTWARIISRTTFYWVKVVGGLVLAGYGVAYLLEAPNRHISFRDPRPFDETLFVVGVVLLGIGSIIVFRTLKKKNA